MKQGQTVLSLVLAVLVAALAFAALDCGTRNDNGSGSDVDHNGGGDGGVGGGDGGGVGPAQTVTIMDLQQGKVQEKQAVTVKDVIVTSPSFKSSSKSASADSFFVEDSGGGEYSGIMVFLKPAGATVQPGDKVTLNGIFTIYYLNPQIEIDDAAGLVVNGTGAVPAPMVVDPASVKTNGDKAKNYNGALVEVDNVSVTDPAVLGTDGKPHGDFMVSGGLIIGYKFPYSYYGNACDTFSKIVGVLIYSFDQMRLLPRSSDDMARTGNLADDGGTCDYDAGSPADGGAGDGGGADGGTTIPGAVTVVSSNNALPPAWVVSDAAILKSDNSGAGASNHIGELVKLSVQTTVSNNPCPLPYTSGTKTYCDGFNATDGQGNVVVVDIFSFLGSNPTCKSTLPTSGTLPTITGVWQDSYNSTTKVDTWTLALADCAGVGQGTPYSGTGTPPASTEVHDLLANFPTGTQVTVSGVVIAAWTATGAFGFTIEDPAGGSDCGIEVSKGKTSTSTATPPKVGDYVTVTGTAKLNGSVVKAIAL